MTEYEIRWPEMGIPRDGDEVDREWLDDPMGRKVMYLAYILKEIFRIVVLSGVILGQLIVMLSVLPEGMVPDNVGLWLIVAAGLPAVLLDSVMRRIWISPINQVVSKLVFYTLIVMANIYVLSKHHRGADTSIIERLSSILSKYSPFNIWLNRSERKRFPF